jgi:ATP-binding cassette subfamily C protein
MREIFYFLKQIHSFAGSILYINALAMILVGLLEGAGILLLIPMISMSGIVDFNAGGTPVSGAFDFMKNVPATMGLPLILTVFILLVIGQNLIQKQITVRNTDIQEGFLRRMRLDTYNGLLHANWNFFVRKRRSDLINLMLTEVARASGGTNSFLQFMSSLIFTCIQVSLAFWLSPDITVLVLIFGLGLIFFNRKFLKRSLSLGYTNFELSRNYFAGITDQMNGIRDIKSNSLEESRMEWIRVITKGLQDEQVEYSKLKTTSQFYYKSASAVLIAAFIYISVNLFNAQAGQLMLIIVIFSRLWPRVAGIQAALEEIANNLPSFKAIKALQNECKDAIEFENGLHQPFEPLTLDKEMECRQVYFKYNPSDPHYSLHNINIVLPSNQMTAFVGHSGAGKSTLIDLLIGLNKPEKGQVLMDGTLLTDNNLLSLRRAVSYVPQDPYLFNDTIRENLLLVKPDASEEELWQALEFSSAAEFVSKLTNGLDTVIGDRGIRLSGGERQRLVIARAILRKPSILVLDEATSALDTDNEERIQQVLHRLKGKMTVIVIAHRLSTIRNADQVIELEQGKVINYGGFNDIIQKKRAGIAIK